MAAVHPCKRGENVVLFLAWDGTVGYVFSTGPPPLDEVFNPASIALVSGHGDFTSSSINLPDNRTNKQHEPAIGPLARSASVQTGEREVSQREQALPPDRAQLNS